MIRIVCPHCHAAISTAELEQATINGQLSLVCPECAAVLVSEAAPASNTHSLAEHYPEESWGFGFSGVQTLI